jgi:hypothetical protein
MLGGWTVTYVLQIPFDEPDRFDSLNVTLLCVCFSHLRAVTSLNACSIAFALYLFQGRPRFIREMKRGLPKIEWLISRYSCKQSQTDMRNRPSMIAISL